MAIPLSIRLCIVANSDLPHGLEDDNRFRNTLAQFLRREISWFTQIRGLIESVG